MCPPEVPWRRFLTSLFLLLVVACSHSAVSKTTVAQYHRMPGYERAFFTRLFVIGVGETDQRRRLFENTFSRVLSDDSTHALPSWKRLPQSELLTETELEAAIHRGEFDAALITRLVSVGQDENKHEDCTEDKTQPFYSHYKSSYEVAREPGYREGTTTYRLETRLYSMRDGGLVWYALSAPVDPSSVENRINSLVRAAAQRLRQEALIRWGLFTLQDHRHFGEPSPTSPAVLCARL